MEEIELYLDDAREQMTKVVSHVSHELTKIRAGKANPSMLDGIVVPYYGATSPLNQISSITSPDPRTLFIKPWEKSLIQDIEKAIMAANLGLTPQNDGQQVIINIPMLQKVSYDPQKDLVPISIFGAGPYLLGIKASLPVNTLQEFIAYVKANPGKLNYATAGLGGNIHLNTALFVARAGLDMVAVPYKSGAPAMAGLVGGEVEMYFGNASELMQHTDSKFIKILAVSTLQRLPQLPDVPTVAETYPGFDTSSWNGFFAPTGTPQPILDALAEHTIAAAKQPAIVERLNRLAILPFGTTQDEFRNVIERSRVANRVAMKAAGLPIIE